MNSSLPHVDTPSQPILAQPILAQPITLGEIDYFMCAVDRALRRRGKRGNVCALALELHSEAALQAAVARVEQSPLFQSLASLRLSSIRTSNASWRPMSMAAPLRCETREVADHAALESLIASWDLHPRHDSPFQMRPLYTAAGEWFLVFLWHHALFDAHGAERICHALLAGQDGPGVGAPTVHRRQDEERSAAFREHLFLAAAPPIWYPESQCTATRSTTTQSTGTGHPAYTRISFSEEETAQFEATCERIGAGMFKSCVLLAALTRALVGAQIAPDADFFVPTPHDTRRSASAPLTTGNQLSFFFFRLRAAVRSSLKSAAEDLIDQAQYIIEQSIHRQCRAFFRSIRQLPPRLYEWLLDLPTGGRYASFYFSDTGDSLSRFAALPDHDVANATHFAPNFSPPGLAFIASRFRGRLTVMAVSDGETFPEFRRSTFVDLLRHDLLDGDLGS